MSLSCVPASICCTSSCHHRVKCLHWIIPKNISSLPCIYTNQQDSYESIPLRSNWSDRLRASFYWFTYACEVLARRVFSIQAKSIGLLACMLLVLALYVLVREQLSAGFSRIELCNATVGRWCIWIFERGISNAQHFHTFIFTLILFPLLVTYITTRGKIVFVHHS